jgi:outer membrane protein TolC
MGRTVLKLHAVFVAGAALAAFSGCVAVDPWRELSRVPPSRSQPFEGSLADGEGDGGSIAPPAQELAGRTLSLAECIVIALEHNPRTAVSWQAARGAAARVGRAKADYLPTLGFTSSAARGDAAELDGKVDPGTQNSVDALFGVRWLLFDGGGREARVDGAAAELFAAGFQHNTVLQDVALTAEEAYYGLLAAHSFADVAMQTVKQRECQLRLAEARQRAGVVARSDVLKAQAEKAAADLELVRAKNAVQVAKGRLANAMGLRVSADFEVAEPPEVDYTRAPSAMEPLLAEAARNRPELKTALAQVQRQRAAVHSAEARYWPAFALDTGFGWLGRGFPPDTQQWSVGLGVDLPLFTGFDRSYQLQAAQADLAGAVAEREVVLEGVELEVWTAYWQTIEAGEAIEAAQRFVASAEESARVAEGEYENGTGSIIGLIDVQTTRTSAHTQLVQARLDWYTAVARFERALGQALATTESGTGKEVNP